jgi:hypothetical protein
LLRLDGDDAASSSQPRLIALADDAQLPMPWFFVVPGVLTVLLTLVLLREESRRREPMAAAVA